MVLEITVEELSQKMKSQEQFVLLDVRELPELEQAHITDPRLEVAPMSRLGAQGPAALPESAQDKEAVIYVFCHHGVRSAQVTGWLASQGWKNAFSVTGGIAAYASQIDRSVGFY
jgi:rhodanese-related sulfurtransferase